jgi:hypothetical protein
MESRSDSTISSCLLSALLKLNISFKKDNL